MPMYKIGHYTLVLILLIAITNQFDLINIAKNQINPTDSTQDKQNSYINQKNEVKINKKIQTKQILQAQQNLQYITKNQEQNTLNEILTKIINFFSSKLNIQLIKLKWYQDKNLLGKQKQNFQFLSNLSSRFLQDTTGATCQAGCVIGWIILSIVITIIVIPIIFLICFVVLSIIRCLCQFFIQLQRKKHQFPQWKPSYQLNVVAPTFDKVCCICLQNKLCDLKLSCQHNYHLKCLAQWLIRNKSCPTCRKGENTVVQYFCYKCQSQVLIFENLHHLSQFYRQQNQNKFKSCNNCKGEKTNNNPQEQDQKPQSMENLKKQGPSMIQL